MQDTTVPVILIHGWNSHPGVWNRLVPCLDAAGIPWARFDHTGLRDRDLETIAAALKDFLARWRGETGYAGEVDIICHSIGTCIARYLLEVMDRPAKNERVRQLIGLGPPNNGSALAELFNDPDHAKGIIDSLTGVFVPRGFDPSADILVQDVRPASPAMRRLRDAGIRKDITYRIIVTANPAGSPDFFPLFAGKTWVMTHTKGYRQTWEGDGIVAHAESALPGVSLDVLIAPGASTDGLPSPDLFCHINLPKNPQVNARIMEYLADRAGYRTK